MIVYESAVDPILKKYTEILKSRKGKMIWEASSKDYAEIMEEIRKEIPDKEEKEMAKESRFFREYLEYCCNNSGENKSSDKKPYWDMSAKEFEKSLKEGAEKK